jgi:hypothetical protein
VLDVAPQELLLQAIDGELLKIKLDDILKINWYSHSYFVRRGLTDPVEAWEAKFGPRSYD